MLQNPEMLQQILPQLTMALENPEMLTQRRAPQPARLDTSGGEGNGVCDTLLCRDSVL